MANLTASPGWDTVFQIEQNTLALGGPGGPANLQAQALLNRTEDLNARMNALQFADYAALRSYTGSLRSVYVTGFLVSVAPSGIAGLFTRDDSDTTSADNGGTIIVATNGKRWKRSYSGQVNVKWFGAKGDGATDDTTALTAAIAAHDTVYLQAGTYVMAASAFTKSVRIMGAGRHATRILWKTGAGASSLLRFTGAAPIHVQFDELTIDGNKAAQVDAAGYYGSVMLDADGGSSLWLRGVRFVNGRIQDVVVKNPQATPTYFHMEGCEFSDGMEGTLTRGASYVQAQENVVVTWLANRASMPAGATIGRAGFLHQRPEPGAATPAGRAVVVGNHFTNVGRGGAATDTLGCIDVYSGGDGIVVQGNTSRDSLGRFICVKADSGDIAIAGNVCTGHQGSIAPIVCFDQLSDYAATSIGRNLIIAQNIVRGNTDATQGKGIFVAGSDVNASTFENVIVQGNIVDGASQYGIYVQKARNASVLGNKVVASARGVYVDNATGVIEVRGNSFKDMTNSAVVLSGASVSTADLIAQGNTFDNCDPVAVGLFSPVNSFAIKDNIVRGCTTAFQTVGATAQSAITGNDIQGETTTWAKTGTYGLLEYRNNLTAVGPSFTARTLTIAAGVVTVFADYHVIDTEGATATDDLVTINGGYDGRVVTLYAANGARDVVLKDAVGNLQLNGDFTMNNANDSITMMYRSGNWNEVCRSDNGA